MSGIRVNPRNLPRKPHRPPMASSSSEQPQSVLQDISQPPRFGLNPMLVLLWGMISLAMLGFVTVPLPDPYASLFELDETFQYSFQLPFAVFLGAFFGAGAGVTAIVLFCLIGLFIYPLFAGGGGWDYIFEPGFGYYLGMMAGAYLSGHWIHRAFAKSEHSGRSLLILIWAAIAVIAAHTIGTLYLLTLALVGNLSWEAFNHWWIQYSGSPISYDILSAMAMFCLVRLTRLSLWPILY